MAPADSATALHSAPLAVLLAQAAEKAEAQAAETRATYQALTRKAAIRQFRLAALCIEAVSPPIEALSAVSAHLRGEGCARAAALAYQTLRQPALHDHPAVKPARIAICEAVVLYVAAAAEHGDKESFDRELATALGEVPDDIAASQLHNTYRHVMQDVPGAFVSGNVAKGRRKAPKQRAKREEIFEKLAEPFEDVPSPDVMPSEPQSEPDVCCGATMAASKSNEAAWHEEMQRLLVKIRRLPNIIQDIGEDGNMLNDTLEDIYDGLWWYLERASVHNQHDEDHISARYALLEFAQHQPEWVFPLHTEMWVDQEFCKYNLQKRFTTVVLFFGVKEILAPLVRDPNEAKLEAAYGALRFVNDLMPFSRDAALDVLQFVLGQGQFEAVSVDELSLQCRASGLGVVGYLLPGTFDLASPELLDAALEEALAVSEQCVDGSRMSVEEHAPVLHVALWAIAQMPGGTVRGCGQEERLHHVATTWLRRSDALRPDVPGVGEAREQAHRLMDGLC